MAIISSYSLNPYKDKFGEDELLHLLRRSLFGVGHKDINFYKGKKLDKCLDALLKPSPAPPPAIEEYFPEGNDPHIPLGQTWVNAPFENEETNYKRKIMLRMWWLGRLINRDFSLTEKMTLFWHNHFVTEMDIVKDSRYSYHYIAMLRANSLGSYKKLIREGSVGSAMLVYLGGHTNFKSAPNENFARELMELFTLGKGYGVQYTEDDVKAAARVLTGWRDDKDKIVSVFDSSKHDTGDKKFSAFFNNEIIKGREGMEGANEVDDLIEMIFKRKEAARFVCRNLYRWFVFGHVDEKIEAEIITTLSETLIKNNFELGPVLRTLLSSEHFFDHAFRGCIVKSPIDFLVGFSQQIGMNVYLAPNKSYTTLAECHEPWAQYYLSCEDLTQRIGDPPTVAGWPAYYQAPKYHQWWVDSASLTMRKILSDALSTHEGLLFNGYNVSFDFFSFAKQFTNPENRDGFVDQCVHMLCAVPPNESSTNQLRGLLVSGMETDYYWEKAWKKLSQNPDDKETKEVLEARLRMFFAKLFSLPEYQMM
jgi:uncharacterized protein (DUF1800 family)